MGKIVFNKKNNYYIDSFFLFLFFQPFLLFNISTAYFSIFYFLISSLVYNGLIIKKTIWFFWCLILLHLICMCLYYQSLNYSLTLLIKFGSAIFIAGYLYKKYKTIYDSLLTIALASVYHYVIIILQIMAPAFRNTWFSFVINSGIEKLPESVYNEIPLRANGVNGFLFAEDGAIFAFSFIFLFFYKRTTNDGLFRKLYYSICQILSILLALISGRTSLVVILLNLHVVFCSFKLSKKIVFILTVSFSIAAVSLFIFETSPELFNWLYEPINNIFSGKPISGSTSDTIQNHLYWLKDISSNLLGYGIFSFEQSDYDVYGIHQSDSGYVRLLVSGGVIQVFLFLLPSLYMFFYTLPKLRKTDKLLSTLYLDFLFFSCLFTFKSFFLFSGYYWVVSICFYLYSCPPNRKLTQ